MTVNQITFEQLKQRVQEAEAEGRLREPNESSHQNPTHEVERTIHPGEASAQDRANGAVPEFLQTIRP